MPSNGNGPQVPEFKSTIPPELLKRLDPEEIYLFEAVSKLEQMSAWMVNETAVARKTAEDLSVKIDQLADRVKALEDWKTTFTGKWGVLSAAFMLILSAAIGAFAKSFADKLMRP